MPKPSPFPRVLAPLILACGAAVAAATPPAAEPLAPAALARLAGRGADPLAQEQWRRALRDPRPDVRAAAARSLHVSAATALVPELAAAAAVETDVTAAAETVRALASLGDGSVDGVVLRTAARLGGDLLPIAGDALGRARSLAALAHLATLRASDSDGHGRRALAHAATHGSPDGLALAGAAALRDRDDVFWEAVLDLAREGRPLDEGLMVAGVSSSSPRVQAVTYWHLAGELVAGRPPSHPAMQAILATEDTTAGDDLDRHFAERMFRRARGGEAQEDAAWVARARDGQPVYLPRKVAIALRPRFTAGEWSAVETWLLGSLKEELQIKAVRPRGLGGSGLKGVAEGRLRAGGTFPRGYATGLVPLTGCRPEKDAWIGVGIRYGRDGRPRHVSIPEGLSKNCEEVARVLAISSLAPLGYVTAPDEPEVLVLHFGQEWFACLEAESPGASPAPFMRSVPRARHRLTEPKKVRHVNPVYPDRAKIADLEGDVELAATVGAAGCVYDIRGVRGPTLLAAPLLLAVTGWRYDPPRLDGRPVVTPMSVHARFSLMR